MPSLLLEDIPPEVYERLQQRAARKQRSLSEETVEILRQAIETQAARNPRVPDYIPGEEIVPPCDLPRTSIPVPVDVVPATKPRLPDPPLFFGEDAPE
jgi:plasmid stability protein